MEDEHSAEQYVTDAIVVKTIATNGVAFYGQQIRVWYIVKLACK